MEVQYALREVGITL